MYVLGIFWNMGLWLEVHSGRSISHTGEKESLRFSLALALSDVSLSKTQWLITAEIFLV